ncbi:MAG: bifunctional [glutamine synthetase] adenylyltransferase/[glutamine synthetase]-adenylyl-L-tyrosine phosphorylase [Propionibacteriaceae bacterium]
MDRTDSFVGALARRGFLQPRRIAAVAKTWEWFIDDIADTADPDATLATLERLRENQPTLIEDLRQDPILTQRLLAVVSASEALGRHLWAVPEDLKVLKNLLAIPSRARLIAELSAVDNPDSLRLIYRRWLLQIAALDLTATDATAHLEVVARQLSDLADAVLAAALVLASKEVGGVTPKLAIIALGKTGAQELNYVSDVDVLFVVEPVVGQTESQAIAQGNLIAAALMRICSAHTPAGTIWAVDAGLRPEGKAGPLARTMAGMDSYYRKWAQPWEFQAMLKARPAAGDQELGETFCAMIAPLVWKVGDQPRFVSQCQAMRQRVVSLLPLKERTRNIKLSAGGLRDIEFTAQLLQLVHGRTDNNLRTPATLPALKALADGGYIGRSDGAELAQQYRLLRVLEHRLQLVTLRRTHLLSDNPTALRRLSRQLSRQTSYSDAEFLWKTTGPRVLQLHQQLYYSPLLEAVAQVPSGDLMLTDNAACDRLTSLGFVDSRAALRHIASLTCGLRRASAILRALMPALLGWLAQSPQPDAGLLAFRQLTEALGDSPWFLGALRDQGAMAERLATVLGRSRYVVDLMTRDPAAVAMLADETLLIPRSASAIAAEMTAVASRQSSVSEAIAAIRTVRRRELLRISVGDVLQITDLDTVGSGLSDLTSATIDAALNACAGSHIGVIAMGRWGGCEQGWGSDADVQYVVADDVDIAEATKIVQQLRTLLAAPGTEPALLIDAELRPEGKNGPLVRSLASCDSYYRRWSAAWEAQALVRAAHGAGNLEVTTAFLQQIQWLRAPQAGPSEESLLDMRRLKIRMETERTRGRSDNLKLSPGGLSDVEWTVQLLQLTHAAQYPELQVTGTMAALEKLRQLELITSEDAAALAAAWRFASRARNATMLVRGRSSDTLPTDPRDGAAVAVLMGYGAAEWSLLKEDQQRLARHGRTVTDRLFYGIN